MSNIRRFPALNRRGFLGASAAAASSALVLPASADEASDLLRASPPEGFKPMKSKGRIVKVEKGGDFAALMQKNLLWPKPEIAKQMLERALTTLTGKSTIAESLGRFIHKDDTVAVKVNGIAGQSGATMAVNLELIVPLLEGLIELGVPPEKITVFEQFGSYLTGTRVHPKGKNLPSGVKVGVHGNGDAKMKPIAVFEKVKTRYVRFLTEATAVIDMTQIKDHSICGFTGCLKNISHGTIVNPEKHHAHKASPQIAVLYNHPIVTSRVRLHIVDGFKIIYDQGPLDKNPKRRIPHGAVYATTDPVAMDTIGWQIIDQARKDNNMKTLAEVNREPTYIAKAADFKLGEHRLDKIKMTSVTI
ncbi:MAG: DUF362 domain-containing protein [Polyangiaceae bacterium]|nr:DUF362 domain-containing protein [Polyangiaceae bacterium]